VILFLCKSGRTKDSEEKFKSVVINCVVEQIGLYFFIINAGQLQGSQLQSGQVLNLPFASIIGAPGSGQLNRMPMPAYGLGATKSNVLEGIGRMSTVEYKSQNVHILQGNDYSISSIVCFSSILTRSDFESGMNISGIKASII